MFDFLKKSRARGLTLLSAVAALWLAPAEVDMLVNAVVAVIGVIDVIRNRKDFD